MNHFIFVILFARLIFSKVKEKSYEKELSEFLKWTKKYNLTFTNITLKEEPSITKEFGSSTYLSFWSTSNISKETEILKIPSTLFISLRRVSPLLRNKTKEIWQKINSSNTSFYQRTFLKEESFLSLLQAQALNKKKGKFYKKYGPYLNLIDKITKVSVYPLLMKDDEIILIQKTILGRDIISNKKYLLDEEKFLKNVVKVTTPNFQKFRVLTNSKIEFLNEELSIVPISDLFIRRPDIFSNAYFEMDKNGDIIIKSLRDIEVDEPIVIQCKHISNSRSYLYFGYTLTYNPILGPNIINFFHQNFKEATKNEVNWNRPNNFIDITSPTFYNEAEDFYKSAFGDRGIKEMAKGIIKNLNFYIRDYNEITNEELDKYIIDEQNKENLKQVLKEEKGIIQIRVDYYQDILSKKETNKKEEL